jgi:PsbN protein
MESTTVLVVSVGAIVIAITALSIYTSFGPPSKNLSDPFDEHED